MAKLKLKRVKTANGAMHFAGGKLVSKKRFDALKARRAAPPKRKTKPAAPKRKRTMARKSRRSRPKSKGPSTKAIQDKDFKQLGIGFVAGATIGLVAEQYIPDDIMGIDGSIIVGAGLVMLAKGKRKQLIRGFGLGVLVQPVSELAAGVVKQTGVLDSLSNALPNNTSNDGPAFSGTTSGGAPISGDPLYRSEGF